MFNFLKTMFTTNKMVIIEQPFVKIDRIFTKNELKGMSIDQRETISAIDEFKQKLSILEQNMRLFDTNSEPDSIIHNSMRMEYQAIEERIRALYMHYRKNYYQ